MRTSAVFNERWVLIIFGDICGPACHYHCICGYTLTIPPPYTLPYYPRTNHPSCPLPQFKTIWGGLPQLTMGARRRNLRLARGSADSVCPRTHRYLHHAPPRPHTRPRTHTTPLHAITLHSHLPLYSHPPHTHTFITSVDHKGVTCYGLRGRGVESWSLIMSEETRDLSGKCDRSRVNSKTNRVGKSRHVDEGMFTTVAILNEKSFRSLIDRIELVLSSVSPATWIQKKHVCRLRWSSLWWWVVKGTQHL